MSVRAGVGSGGGAPGSFLTMEEAGLVEMASIDMHEKFLCRLTVHLHTLLNVLSPLATIPSTELVAVILVAPSVVTQFFGNCSQEIRATEITRLLY